MLIASTAYADRTFNLEGTVRIMALGERLTEDVSGTLTLFDDGTYTLNEEGEISSGIWLEERNKIQLFQEAPTVSEFVAELEEELSDAVGMAISLTSLALGKNLDHDFVAAASGHFQLGHRDVAPPCLRCV